MSAKRWNTLAAILKFITAVITLTHVLAGPSPRSMPGVRVRAHIDLVGERMPFDPYAQ